jgi:RNA polymerase sigma factor (TIGR02999 family)
MRPPEDVTLLLARWREGAADAEAQLMEAVQRELRKIAAAYLRRERAGGTIVAPTELVNDAYLRLTGSREVAWENRAHFYGIAAQVMRRILVDHARRRNARKRDYVKLSLSVADIGLADRAQDLDILALHAALEELAELDSRQANILTLRYFGGLTVEELAEAQGISPATVKRELLTAKIWLRHRLSGESARA